MFTIRQFPFNDCGQASSVLTEGGNNWPVVYLISNDTDIFIGETTSFGERFREHLYDKNKRYNRFTEICFAYDGTENKSVVQDYESNLVRLFDADGRFQRVFTASPGQSHIHAYHQQDLYDAKVSVLWNQLYGLNLTKLDYQSVKNSLIYKLSPFTSLSSEQREVMKAIFEDFLDSLRSGQKGGALVNGGAGTGKSLMAVKIIDILLNAGRYLVDWEHSEGVYGEDWRWLLSRLEKNITQNGPLKVAYIAPQQSFNADMQRTLGKVSRNYGQKVVHNTSNIVSRYQSLDLFDIVLVDETHRLKHRNGMGNDIGLFDENRRRLNLPDEATQLDVILARTKYCCLLYDSEQSIKNSDITPEELERSLHSLNHSVIRRNLSVQMRCLGGGDYNLFLDDVFSGNPTPHIFKDYDFRVYDDVTAMVNEIRNLNKSYGLCRTLAGFAWPWKTKRFIQDNKNTLAAMGGPNKGKNTRNLLELNQYDILIGKARFVWNIKNKCWMTSQGAEDEIGCIHTSQGYDMNYCGVILGPDIRYDKESKRIVIDPSSFCDPFLKRHKKIIPEADVRRYIINAYRTLLLRGIYGCYVYAVDDNLRVFLEQCEKHIKTSVSNLIEGADLIGLNKGKSQSFDGGSRIPTIQHEICTDKQLGKTISFLRKEKGISQEELAYRAGINRSYMGVIERGEKSPSLGTIAKVANGLGLSVGDLFAARQNKE